MKRVETWHSDRLDQPIRVVRWGEFGVPVLVFPTAGGDAEEIERFGLIAALSGLLSAGRIKVYSVDSIAGRSMVDHGDRSHTAWLFNRFSLVIGEEVVPAIRLDCHDDTIEVVAAGASIGAVNALAALCRHPSLFRIAIGMSGTYDLSNQFDGFPDDFYFASPLHYLPGLDGEQLRQIRGRFVGLATGSGDWENPGETWAMAHVLGEKGVPNRVDIWSENHHHQWDTWREMLPLYLDDLA